MLERCDEIIFRRSSWRYWLEACFCRVCENERRGLRRWRDWLEACRGLIFESLFVETRLYFIRSGFRNDFVK